jgi:hypothetical protein
MRSNNQLQTGEGVMASSDLKERNAGHRDGRAVLWWRHVAMAAE